MQLPKSYDIVSDNYCQGAPSFQTEVATILRLHGCHRATITFTKSTIAVAIRGSSTATLPSKPWTHHDSPLGAPNSQPNLTAQQPTNTQNPPIPNPTRNPGTLPEGFSYLMMLKIRQLEDLQQVAKAAVEATGQCSACSSSVCGTVADALGLVQQHSAHNAEWAQHMQAQQKQQPSNHSTQQQQQHNSQIQPPSDLDSYTTATHLNIQVAAALIINECAHHILIKPASKTSRPCQLRNLAADILQSYDLGRITAQHYRPSVNCIQRAFADQGYVPLWSCIGAAPHHHVAVLLDRSKHMAAEARCLVALLRGGQQQQQQQGGGDQQQQGVGDHPQQQQQQQSLISPGLLQKVTKQQLLAALQQLLRHQYNSTLAAAAAAAAASNPQQQQQVVIDESFITKWLSLRGLKLSDALAAANNRCIDSSIDYCIICGISDGADTVLITCDYCCHCFHTSCAKEQGMPAAAAAAAAALVTADQDQDTSAAATAATDLKVACLGCMGFPDIEREEWAAAAAAGERAGEGPGTAAAAARGPAAAAAAAAGKQGPTAGDPKLLCLHSNHGDPPASNAAAAGGPAAAAAVAVDADDYCGHVTGSESEVTDDGEDEPAAAAAAAASTADSRAQPRQQVLLARGDRTAVEIVAAAFPAAAPMEVESAAGADWQQQRQQQDAAMRTGAKALHDRDQNPQQQSTKQLLLLPQKRSNPASSSQGPPAAAAAAGVPSDDAVPNQRPIKRQCTTRPQQQQQQQHGTRVHSQHTAKQTAPNAGQPQKPSQQQLLKAHAAAAAAAAQPPPLQQQQRLALSWRVMRLRSTPLYDQLTALLAEQRQWPVLQRVLDFWTDTRSSSAAAAAAGAASGSTAAPSSNRQQALSAGAASDAAAAGSGTRAVRLKPSAGKIASRWNWQGLVNLGIPDMVLDLHKDLDLGLHDDLGLAGSAGNIGPMITADQAGLLLLQPCLAAVKAVFAVGLDSNSSSSSRDGNGASMLGASAVAADPATSFSAVQQQQQQQCGEGDPLQPKQLLVGEMLLLCKCMLTAAVAGRATSDQCKLTAAVLAAAAAAAAAACSTQQQLDDLASVCWHLRSLECQPGRSWQQYKQQQQQQQQGQGGSTDTAVDTSDTSEIWNLLWQCVPECSPSKKKKQQQQQQQGIHDAVAAATTALEGISLHALQQLLTLLSEAASAAGSSIADLSSALSSKQCTTVHSNAPLLITMHKALSAAEAMRSHVCIAVTWNDPDALMQQQQQEAEVADLVQQEQQLAMNALLPAFTDVLSKGLALALRLAAPAAPQQQQQQVDTAAVVAKLLSQVTALAHQVFDTLVLPTGQLLKFLDFVSHIDDCEVVGMTLEVLERALAAVQALLDKAPLAAADAGPCHNTKDQFSATSTSTQTRGAQGVLADGATTELEAIGAESQQICRLLMETVAGFCT